MGGGLISQLTSIGVAVSQVEQILTRRGGRGDPRHDRHPGVLAVTACLAVVVAAWSSESFSLQAARCCPRAHE